MTRILLLQGANMAYLGKRQPEIYGATAAAELDRLMLLHAKKIGVSLDIVYTHIEGEAIAHIYRAADEGTDGLQSYFMGMDALLDLIKDERPARGRKQ